MHLDRVKRFSNIGTTVLACLLCVAGLLVCVGLASCGGASASSSNSSAEASYRHVSVEEAAELMKEPGTLVADVRGEVDYDMGHIPGAICVGYDRIESGKAATLLPDKDQPIIVYCDHGGVSKKAAEKLASDGYTNVIEFDGLEVWKGELETEVESCC